MNTLKSKYLLLGLHFRVLFVWHSEVYLFIQNIYRQFINFQIVSWILVIHISIAKY